MIELYKGSDNDSMAIVTDAKDEREFLGELSALFSTMISDGEYLTVFKATKDEAVATLEVMDQGRKKRTGDLVYILNDWEFNLDSWLPQVVDICCKYRGYKSAVKEKRVLISGGSVVMGKPTHIFPRE